MINTTTIKQIQGGRVIKQQDYSSTLGFILLNANGEEVDLNGQTADISLYTDKLQYKTTAEVSNSNVIFNLPGNLKEETYILEIECAGYVFPSDNNFLIKVTKGNKNYTDAETAEYYKKTIEEITADVQKNADENLKQAISLIGTKKDQALQEIDTKAENIAETVNANVEGFINNKVDDEVQKLKDLIYGNEAKYQDDMIYILDPYIEGEEVKFKPKEIGKLLENDFLKVPVNADKMRFRIKSSSQGIILLYSLTDESLQYAIHVYPNIKDYEIDFGKVVDEELIFTSVTMPEDKVSVIREEGFGGN